MENLRPIFLTFLYFSLSLSNGLGQNLQASNQVAFIADTTLFFNKINDHENIRYYRDDTKLKEITRYLEKGDKDDSLKALDALEKYVTNFRIKNFQEDHYLLWRLGNLAEKLGLRARAQAYYRLVLKHHPKGNAMDYRLYDPNNPEYKRILERGSQYQRYFDSLTVNEREYYLPVEYYYTYANAASNIDTLDIPESIYTSVGDSVNSIYNDYAPALTGNDLVLVFTSQRNRYQEGMRYLSNEDLFYSRKADSLYITETEAGSRVDTLPWTEAKPLKEINTKYNEGSVCYSKDGRTIYFARCQSPDGYGDCDLYVIKQREDGSWGKAYNLGINVNSRGWDSQPALSHTEDTLFFASDRIGGFGLSDIYYSYRTNEYEVEEIEDQDGNITIRDTLWVWAQARNMGPIINTRYNEVSPYYHPKYELLYFSSNGHLVNFGGFDIYKSYREDTRWTEPWNIGPLVNYHKDEYYFTIDARSQNLYYAKLVKFRTYDYARRDTVTKEALNLHTAFLPMEARPEATTSLKGVVTDSISGEALEGIISIIDLDNGIEVAPKYLRPDGSYQFDLIRNNNYLVIITGEDFFRVERQFLLKGDTTLNFATPSIKFKKWKFEAIEFQENSAKITPKMTSDLQKLVMFLSDNPTLGLKISGHTDSQGDANDNMQLSQARADAIKDYLVKNGRFPAERIEAIGYGSTLPIIQEEKTDDDRRINRRVEFEIVKME